MNSIDTRKGRQPKPIFDRRALNWLKEFAERCAEQPDGRTIYREVGPVFPDAWNRVLRVDSHNSNQWFVDLYQHPNQNAIRIVSSSYWHIGPLSFLCSPAFDAILVGDLLVQCSELGTVYAVPSNLDVVQEARDLLLNRVADFENADLEVTHAK